MGRLLEHRGSIQCRLPFTADEWNLIDRRAQHAKMTRGQIIVRLVRLVSRLLSTMERDELVRLLQETAES